MASTTPPPSDDDKPEGAAPRAPAGLFDNDLANTVKQSAQQIWLAGLGAFAKAQEEGTKVFEALVREGTSLQRRTQPAPAEEQQQQPQQPSAAAGGFATQATQQWDRLESIFEDRVAKALHRLGVPSLKVVAALEARIDELAAEVERLSSGARAGSPGATAAASGDAADAAAAPSSEPGTEAR